MMQIAYHRYELRSAAPLGALSLGNIRRGALLQVRSAGGKTGYSDLHPWEELGDLPLSDQLDRLAHGQHTDLSEASLGFAALDADARAAERSLWVGLAIPESHFLLPGISENDRETLEAALAEGFTHFKIKMGKNLVAERTHLRELTAFLGGVTVSGGGAPRLRLDYNETLTADQFSEYFAGIEETWPFLDFIEDPFPFGAERWTTIGNRLGLSFAVDRAGSEEAAAGFQGVTIQKPARTGPRVPASLPNQRLIVTSYLDHPIGQLCAAWVASQLPEQAHSERHGLVSHRLYARTEFSDRLGWSGPRLQLPEGTGFGFDDELAALDWKILR